MIRKSNKDRQQGLQNITYETKDRVKRTPIKTEGKHVE